MQVAERCEAKNCRLYYDVLQELYFVVQKNKDGSILHTKETQLFQSVELSKVDEFINQLTN